MEQTEFDFMKKEICEGCGKESDMLGKYTKLDMEGKEKSTLRLCQACLQTLFLIPKIKHAD